MSWRRSVPILISGAVAGLFAFAAVGQIPGPRFGDPMPGLPRQLLTRFNDGKAQFEEDETIPDGLGPVFNNTSCVSCHSVGATGGGSTTLVTRFGRFGNGIFDPL